MELNHHLLFFLTSPMAQPATKEEKASITSGVSGCLNSLTYFAVASSYLLLSGGIRPALFISTSCARSPSLEGPSLEADFFANRSLRLPICAIFGGLFFRGRPLGRPLAGVGSRGAGTSLKALARNSTRFPCSTLFGYCCRVGCTSSSTTWGIAISSNIGSARVGTNRAVTCS